MKKIIIPLFLLLFLVSSASAQIIINQQPPEENNFGGTINTLLTIKSVTEISEILELNVICNGKEKNYYKNGISLSAGEEKKIETSLILSKEMIGIGGSCVIKAILGEEYILSQEFKVSDIIIVTLKEFPEEIDPDRILSLSGTATRMDGKEANGFVTLEILSENTKDSRIQEGTVTNGFFSIEIDIPKDMKAGKHLVKIDVYEKNSLDEVINKGFVNQNLRINQIPTSLEIFFEERDVTPGTNLKVKTILHDQTGEKIESGSMITIKNNENTILEQRDIKTDEFFEMPIKKNEAPATWKIFAMSNRLSAENTFKIKENPEIKVEILNKTIEVTNVGNVVYSDILLVKIGEESRNLNITLNLGETKKYLLTAPDGEYLVETMGVSSNVLLTGDAINVREAGEGVIRIIRKPLSWIFMLMILGFMALIIFKKGYKKSFFGYIHSKKKKIEKPVPQEKNSLINSKNKVNVSLSIKGDKQNASLICLKIKNLQNVEKEGIKEAMKKLSEKAESEKALIYENQENLFFMFAPAKTRTFKNEIIAIKFAEEIKKVLEEHNRMKREKIEFGLSLNEGSIVINKENTLFMSLGNLVTIAKKISSISKGEVLLSERMKEKLITDIKTEKQMVGDFPVYKITEIKNREENKKFLDSFVKRQREERK
jgi:hypothetical protein